MEYSKSQIDDAGRKVILKNISSTEKDNYLNIIDKWRAIHAYPMKFVAANIKRRASGIGNNGDIVIAQRLKRLDTILNKLVRYPNMKLSRMQDLGGCRVILPTIEDVYNLRNHLIMSKMQHKLHSEKDYIKTPKADTGYRGIHLIYEYGNNRNPQYNGLLVEVQLRTKLQHLWATAVETVGMFTQNGLKFNQGDETWLKFFQLASIIFAAEEEKKKIKTLEDVENLHKVVREYFELRDKFELEKKLYGFGMINSALTQTKIINQSGYYLLQLNIQNSTLIIEYFKDDKASRNAAVDKYTKLESSKQRNIDVVLVAAESIHAVKTAYQNYFADIREFTDKIVSCMSNQLNKCEKLLKQESEKNNQRLAALSLNKKDTI